MGNLIDFNNYFKKYSEKNIQVIFGENLIAISFDDENDLKVDGIILEQDSMGVITPDAEENVIDEGPEMTGEFDDDFWNSVYAFSEFEIGSAYIEDPSDMTNFVPSVFSPLKVRVVVFDLTAKDEEDIYRYRELVRAYIHAFRIMDRYNVKKVRLRPLGIYYSFVPMEDSVRAILRALDNFAFEKVYLTVRNKREAEKLWSYIIPFAEKKGRLRNRDYEKDGN